MSAASTAATESSQSWMVVIADSTNTSLIPAGSSIPMLWSLSIWISRCKLLFFNKIPVGLLISPAKPIYWLVFFNSDLVPSDNSTCRLSPKIIKLIASS